MLLSIKHLLVFVFRLHSHFSRNFFPLLWIFEDSALHTRPTFAEIKHLHLRKSVRVSGSGIDMLCLAATIACTVVFIPIFSGIKEKIRLKVMLPEMQAPGKQVFGVFLLLYSTSFASHTKQVSHREHMSL